MPDKGAMAGLLGMLGGNSGQQANTLLRLGSAGVIRKMVQSADKQLEERGGSLITREANRFQRQMAATIRRQAKRGSVTRSVSRAAAKSARPSAVQRRNMRRDNYARQSETLSDEQLLSIPASELPPELVKRRKQAMKDRPRDENGRFLPAGSAPAAPAEAPATEPATAPAPKRQKIDQQLRDIIGDPDKLPPHVREQLEQQIAEKFGTGETPAQTSPTPSPPQPTPAQRKRENTQAVIDSQLEDAPQPRPDRAERADGGGGLMDKIQTGLDVVGVADPTPIVDGANAVISLGRAAFDPERRGEHLQNAGISAVSAVVPYVGDTAKLLKVGRAARKSHAARGAERAAVDPAEIKRTAQPGPPPVQGESTAGASTGRGGIRGAARRITEGFSGGGSGGDEPPRFGAPSPAPGDDGDSPQRRREETEGIVAHDKWTEKLKDGALSMASFVGKAYLAVESLQLLNMGVLALNKHLSQYSGTLATSYAKGENADIQRDMRKANALSGPLSHLQEETTELKDTMSQLAIPIQYTLIKILAMITAGVNGMVEFGRIINPIAAKSLEQLIKLASQDHEAPGGRQFLQDLSDGKFDGFGIDDVGKRFEILDRQTRDQMGLTPKPQKPKRGKPPAP